MTLLRRIGALVVIAFVVVFVLNGCHVPGVHSKNTSANEQPSGQPTQTQTPGDQPTDTTPTDTTSDEPTDTDTATVSDSPPAVQLIKYPDNDGLGVEISKASDVDKLTGAPDDFKTFLTHVLAQAKADDKANNCGSAVGVSVHILRTDGWAIGTVNSCGGAVTVWQQQDGSWVQVIQTQEAWQCTVLKKFKIPSDLVGTTCYTAAGASKPYAQK